MSPGASSDRGTFPHTWAPTFPYWCLASPAISAMALENCDCAKTPRKATNHKATLASASSALRFAFPVLHDTLHSHSYNSPAGRPLHNAANTRTRHPEFEGRAQLFHLGATTRRLALQETSTGGRREGRKGGCQENTEHRCGGHTDADAESTVARVQSRGLQCAAIETVPHTRDGPLVRRHDRRRDIPRDDAPPGRQAYLYATPIAAMTASWSKCVNCSKCR
jgi:hypothetical protein